MQNNQRCEGMGTQDAKRPLTLQTSRQCFSECLCLSCSCWFWALVALRHLRARVCVVPLITSRCVSALVLNSDFPTCSLNRQVRHRLLHGLIGSGEGGIGLQHILRACHWLHSVQQTERHLGCSAAPEEFSPTSFLVLLLFFFCSSRCVCARTPEGYQAPWCISQPIRLTVARPPYTAFMSTFLCARVCGWMVASNTGYG